MSDNAGGTGSSSATITVDAAVQSTVMRVAAIDMALVAYDGGRAGARATVRVVDANGLPVAGARIIGAWSGLVSQSASQTTGANGLGIFLSPATTTATGSFRFAVAVVTRSGSTYAPRTNTETMDSIAR